VSGHAAGAFAESGYLSLTTFRRDGRPVATPVWFAVDGDRILMWSGASEGKVKRIRNNSRVMVAVCDYKGKVKGPAVEATAVLLSPDAGARIHRLLNRKYWYVKPPYEAVLGILRLFRRRKSRGAAYIEIRFSQSRI
jgi:PPOX class probable F420-dependent enzyme